MSKPKTDELDRHDLVKATAEKLLISEAEAKATVDTFLELLATGLAEKGRVELHGHGAFVLKHAAARKGTLKGKDFDYPEGLAIKFHPAKSLKEKIAAARQVRVI